MAASITGVSDLRKGGVGAPFDRLEVLDSMDEDRDMLDWSKIFVIDFVMKKAMSPK